MDFTCPVCSLPYHEPTIVDFVTSPCYLGPDDQISPAQLSVLKAIYGLPMTVEELKQFLTMTEGRPPRSGGYQEATIIVGQRSGKTDKIAANMAVYEAFLFDSEILSRGEWAYVMLVAQDAEGARQARDYIEGKLLLLESRGWSILDEGKAQERAITGREIRTTKRVKFKIFPCKRASVRSKTGLLGIADELAWWQTEDVAYNHDKEIIRALRGRGATLGRRAKLIKISSPYGESGVLWDDFQGRHSTRDLVINCPSWVFFPGLDTDFLERERQKDPVAFLRDYGGQFGKAGGSYISPEDLDRCINKTRPAIIPKQPGCEYLAKVDVGFKRDLYVLGIAHADGQKVVVDLIQWWRGTKKQPLDSEQIALEVKEYLLCYGLESVISDQYADVPIKKDYEKIGINFIVEAQTQDQNFEMFMNFKAGIRRGLLDLPDDSTMRQDILALQSKKSGNKFKIAAPDSMGFHDDISNVLAILFFKLNPMSGHIDLTEVNARAMPDYSGLESWQREMRRDDKDDPGLMTSLMERVF